MFASFAFGFAVLISEDFEKSLAWCCIRRNSFCAAMSDPSDLLSQKVCHYHNQGRTLNDKSIRAARWMAYYDLSKVNLTSTNILEVCEPNSSGNRRDKVALRTTCIKNVNFKIIKTRTGCQYVGHFYYSGSLNWAAQNFPLDRGLDIAVFVERKISDARKDSYSHCIF